MPQFPRHDDLKKMSLTDAKQVCADLRQEILGTVSRCGGHLASSLGAVELCVALHRQFDFSGDDSVFFDVGHQAYAHKLLSGREESFQHLRASDGCAGFPAPWESSEDPVSAGHAGVALSQALGAAQAKALGGTKGYTVAVVGDGTIGCGIFWEALNNVRTGGDRFVIILNDNQMSISPNIGSLRRCLNRIIAGRFYNSVRRAVGGSAERHGAVKGFVDRLRRLEHAVKGLFMSSGVLFQEFGVRYFGPVDGNDLHELERILRHLPTGRPVIVHIVTKKGKGYAPAEESPEKFHGVSPFDISTGRSLKVSGGGKSYSEAFSDAICSAGASHPEVVAVSAAMVGGTGLSEFAKRYPSRCFDVGIAEEHAVAFASGLACRGMRPVVALYSTFFQRALDNVYHDVCLNHLPVVFCLDRTGAVPDGPTHHGIYALPFLRHLPNLEIIAPSNEADVKAMLDYALTRDCAVVIRYPRGNCVDVPKEQTAECVPMVTGKAQIVCDCESPSLTIWTVGAELATALKVAERMEERQGVRGIRIVNARFLLPFDDELAVRLSDTPQAVIDDYTGGGLAECLREAWAEHGLLPAFREFHWPDRMVLEHGSILEMRRRYSLTAEDIADNLSRWLEERGMH